MKSELIRFVVKSATMLVILEYPLNAAECNKCQ